MKSTFLAVVLLVLLGAVAFLFVFDPAGPAPTDESSAVGENGVEAAAPIPEAGNPSSEASTTRSEIEAAGAEPGAAIGTVRLKFDGPAAVVTARLVDGKGKPALGAEAEVVRAGEDSHGWLTQPPESEDELNWDGVPADRDGRVRIEVPADIGLHVEFGGAYWRVQSRDLKPLREGEIADFGELALTSATRLTGRITGEGNAPLAGAKVQLRAADAGEFWQGHNVLESAETDAEGLVHFEGVPRGRVRIEANATSHAAGTIEALEVSGAGEDLPFELQLERGGSLTGHVVDTDRRPIAGAKVFLIHQDENQFYWGDYLPPTPDREPDAVSAADGSFRVEGLHKLAPDAPSRSLLIAHADEIGTGSAKKVRAGEKATITIPRGVRASGVVVTDDGQPLPGATVMLQQETPWGWTDQKASVESDADGHFETPLVPPGKYDVVVSSPIGGTEAMPLDLLRDVDDLRLRVSKDPLLTILVLDPDGQPVPHARVEGHVPGTSGRGQTFAISGGDFLAEPSHSVGWSATADADEYGRAIFRDPPSAEIKLTVVSQGWARLHTTLLSSGSDQEETLTLERPGTLVVLVKDGGGQSVRGVSIRLRNPEQDVEAEKQNTDHLGRAVWRDLAPGRWEVSHDAGGGGDGDHFMGSIDLLDFGKAEQTPTPEEPGTPVKIEAGQQTEHEILLDDLAVLTVRVLRGGMPAPDVAVRLQRKQSGGNYYSGWNSSEVSGTRTDARGIAVLTPVSAGDYQLIAKTSRNTPETTEDLTLHAGPELRNLQLNGAEVRGTLRDRNGPLAGARVTLSRFVPEGEEGNNNFGGMIAMGGSDGAFSIEFGDGGDSSNASSDQDGEYLFQDVPEGQWVVKAKRKGVGPWTSLPFTVSGDRAVRVGEHTMLPGAVLHGHDDNWTGPREESARFNFDWNSSIRVETSAGRIVGMTQVNDRGEWRVEDLEEGEYVVMRGSWRSAPVHLSAGEVQRQDIPKEEPKAPRDG